MVIVLCAGGGEVSIEMNFSEETTFILKNWLELIVEGGSRQVKSQKLFFPSTAIYYNA